MNDPCDRCDGEGKDCVGCSHIRQSLKQLEKNCYNCGNDNCREAIALRYNWEPCKNWKLEQEEQNEG